MTHQRAPLPSTRRQFFQLAGAAALAAWLVECRSASAADLPPADLPAAVSHSAVATDRLQPAKGTLDLGNIALDERIGQMLMLGFDGARLTSKNLIVKNIRDQHVGNVVIFDNDGTRYARPRNITSRAQLKALTAGLNALAGALPLGIAMDQEGGIISRLKEQYGFPPTLSEEELADLNNLDQTRQHAGQMAATMAEMGITLNLAPVVDVKANPFNPIIARLQRSFSADPTVVAAQAAAFIDGHHDHGIRCTLKHFPGHGSSRGDTHLGFVDVTNTWSEGELIPYRRLLEQGRVDAIMTAHIFNANLDPDLPATLSPAVVTGLLREQLGFDGVILSDDLRMHAISDLFRLDKAIELTILAGVDIVSVATNSAPEGDVADIFFATMHRLLEAGAIDEDRINRSCRRILRMKGLQPA